LKAFGNGVELCIENLAVQPEVAAVYSEVLRSIRCGSIECSASANLSIIEFGAIGVEKESIRWEG
jgi:hypothetical protein